MDEQIHKDFFLNQSYLFNHLKRNSS